MSDIDVDMVDGFLEELPRPPPTSRELDQLQYHINLQEVGRMLQNAVNAAFPNHRRMRYSAVHVLLLCWEDEDPKLPVSIEVEELRDVFTNVYNFDAEVWKIPSEGSHKLLNRKILDFVDIGDDSKDHLKILYYGGHGMLSHNRQSSWANLPDGRLPNFRSVKWSGIQHALEEAESDVLLLLDSCASGTANTDRGHGITELIAACGFNSSANPVGPDSFTRALITELNLLQNVPAFTVGLLYNKILCRVQNWMPFGREMQKPPLHVVLTQNFRLPQSIQISRLPGVSACQKLDKQLNAISSLLGAPSVLEMIDEDHASISDSSNSTGLASNPSVSQSTPASLSSPGSELELFPRIAISVRLKETLAKSEISVDLLAEWLRMIPIPAEHITVEAGFQSCSTLVIISLPIAIWCYLPNHPAISVVGIIKSSNSIAGRSLPCSMALTRDNEKRKARSFTPQPVKPFLWIILFLISINIYICNSIHNFIGLRQHAQRAALKILPEFSTRNAKYQKVASNAPAPGEVTSENLSPGSPSISASRIDGLEDEFYVYISDWTSLEESEGIYYSIYGTSGHSTTTGAQMAEKALAADLNFLLMEGRNFRAISQGDVDTLESCVDKVDLLWEFDFQVAIEQYYYVEMFRKILQEARKTHASTVTITNEILGVQASDQSTSGEAKMMQKQVQADEGSDPSEISDYVACLTAQEQRLKGLKAMLMERGLRKYEVWSTLKAGIPEGLNFDGGWSTCLSQIGTPTRTLWEGFCPAYHSPYAG